ncbi:MAG: sel1 repeat family protein [Moraxellaceae bacterium]|nr:sel1 repeat family protein [Moraxellaceae bacterium]MBH2029953.1 sel1 repeat family protein [Moraxellaceae bacterium]
MIEEFQDVDIECIKVGDFLFTTTREINCTFFSVEHSEYYLFSVDIYDNPYPSQILHVKSVNRDKQQPQNINSINSDATDGRVSHLGLNGYVPKFKSLALEASNLQEFREVYKKYLHEKMQQGDLDAMVLLAEYEQNTPSRDMAIFDQAYLKAKQYLETASENGHAYASLCLAKMYRLISAPHKAKFWAENRPENYKLYIQRSAEQSNPVAQYMLADHYEHKDEGFKKDLKQAVYWYQKAAEQEYPYAMCNLADKYEHGIGIEQDYAKALDYYQQAAQFRIAEAIYSIGKMYLEGKGVVQDIEQARIWLEQASSYSYSPAKKLLLKLMD